MVDPKFITTAIEAVIALLADKTGDILAEMDPPRDPFNRFGKVFRGTAMAPPELWVEPVSTVFDDEGSTVHQLSELKVTLAVTAGDPELLVAAVAAYVVAADKAIRKYEARIQDDTIKRVFVREHNYGSLRRLTTGFAAFPELYLVVEMEEEDFA